VNKSCNRKTFAERMPEFLPFHAQRTLRQTQLLKCLVFEVNGEASSRICLHIRNCASSDTLTRIARRTDLPNFSIPRIIGIDDWAKRKGVDYGTLVVDLEKHQPIEVLPDRTAETITKWLLEHPTIQIVSRDRYPDYIEGIQQGAPTAVQIADRWHLLKNMFEAVQGMFSGLNKELQEAANLLAIEETGGELTIEEKPTVIKVENIKPQDNLLQEVKDLANQGYSNRQIAKMLPIHRETVALYKEVDQIPVRGGGRKHIASPFEKFILQRWQEGCHSPKQIFLEMKEKGFEGGISSAYRYLVHLGMHADQQNEKLQPKRLTASQAAWLLTTPEKKLDAHQKRYRDILFEISPKVSEAANLVNNFIKMIQEKQSNQLPTWLENARKSPIPKIRSFAVGLSADYLAVQSALCFDWSNGQLEGQVNRLKTLKRMMYGRAKFDLLRKRVLCC